jgi:hypothetical protein
MSVSVRDHDCDGDAGAESPLPASRPIAGFSVRRQQPSNTEVRRSAPAMNLAGRAFADAYRLGVRRIATAFELSFRYARRTGYRRWVTPTP